MARSEARRRREHYEAEARERERRKALTIDPDNATNDPQRYLARMIADIDLAAQRLERRGAPAASVWAEHSAGELSRLRACAVAALWRLPLVMGEYAEYPYAGGVVSPGERLLSVVNTFHQAVRPWGSGDWAGRVDPQRARAVFCVPVGRFRRCGTPEYEHTPEELARRAQRAAHAVNRSGVLAVYRSYRRRDHATP